MTNDTTRLYDFAIAFTRWQFYSWETTPGFNEWYLDTFKQQPAGREITGQIAVVLEEALANWVAPTQFSPKPFIVQRYEYGIGKCVWLLWETDSWNASFEKRMRLKNAVLDSRSIESKVKDKISLVNKRFEVMSARIRRASKLRNLTNTTISSLQTYLVMACEQAQDEASLADWMTRVETIVQTKVFVSLDQAEDEWLKLRNTP